MNIFKLLCIGVVFCRATQAQTIQTPAPVLQGPTLPPTSQFMVARAALMQQLIRVLPASEPWEQWLKASGELPPDFDLMPGRAGLPEALEFANGSPVQAVAQWPSRRQELLNLFQYLIWGQAPPAPGNVRATEARTSTQGGVTRKFVMLEFGPESKARLLIALMIPPGNGPFPVFMTQDNQVAWARLAANRGYLGCVYAAADSRDDTEAFPALWPKQDWGRLARRAWAASRCLDYVLTLAMADRTRVALAGHAQNGKASLIAAALDERFSAVISSSSGTGGACTWRLFSEAQSGEGIELVTRAWPDWFHPRLRFFAGRENKLPVDQHEAIACIAPRPCLISTALNDPAESAWAVEQTYYTAQRIYAWLGAGQALNVRYRPGGHAVTPEDLEAYLDWLDTKFGRRSQTFAFTPVYPTQADWQKASGELIDPFQFPKAGLEGLLATPGGNPILDLDTWKARAQEIRQRVAWGLGNAPAQCRDAGGISGAEPESTAALLNRAGPFQDIVKQSVNIGNHVPGDLYLAKNLFKPEVKFATVIWLHPISSATGYNPVFTQGEAPHLALVRRGFAVFAFDQIGNGSRILEAQHFYQRYPHWSLLGKTVQDVLAAVDALAQVNYLDPRRVFVLGYGTGAMAALHAAALDERIAGAVSVGGFTPMRLDAASKGTGGLARWSQWLPLQPRLGAFVGREACVPYDYHEVMALIAPRPLLVVAPRIDYLASAGEVAQSVNEAGKVYEFLKNRSKLSFFAPEDYHHFSPAVQNLVFEQLQSMASQLH